MAKSAGESPDSRQTRDRLIAVAAQLLAEQGLEAMTTRSVADAARVHPPTIYRLFGDKDGLLEHVAEHVFAAHVEGELLTDDDGDPVEDLRKAWDSHISFGLANAALFGVLSDPQRKMPSNAAATGREILRQRIQRIAAIGRLNVTEDRALELVYAAGTGVVLTLLRKSPDNQQPHLADTMYDALIRAILTDVSVLPDDGTTAIVAAFTTVIPDLVMLTQSERDLLSEWLERAADEDDRAVDP